MYHLANGLTLRQAAMLYALMGHKVFPCRVGGKEPLVQWATQATDDVAVVDGLWARWPKANIGLVAGDDLILPDLDVKGGANGPQSWVEAGGPDPAPWPAQVTPSGGRHYLIRAHVEGLRNVTKRGTHGGIDLRVGNGYIVVAPSVLADGGRYEWLPGGDETAPIPERLLTQLLAWSAGGGGGTAAGAVDMPEPSDLSDAEVQARITALGEPHTAFLRSGEAPGGDRSAAAYAACYMAFARGWSLADMARVGPETVLAYYGADAPHGAARPWPWAWRYTVVPAWRAVQDRLQGMFSVIDAGQKEAAVGDSGEGETYRKQIDGGSMVGETAPVNLDLSPDELFALYQVRARGLPHGDHGALVEWVKSALTSGLEEYRIEGLWQEAKIGSGFPVRAIRAVVNHHQRLMAPKRTAAGNSVPEVFIRSQDKFYVKTSGAWVTKSALGSAEARNNGGDPHMALNAYLHGVNAKCETVENLTYHPGLPSGIATDEQGTRVFNRYRPSDLVGTAASIQPWLDLLRFLQVEGGAEVERLLIDEAAFLVQHPGKKLNHGTIIGGVEGAGKDSWLSPVLTAAGVHNCATIHGEDLASEFQGWLSGTKVLVVNEMHVGPHRDRRKIGERLKPLLAAPPDTLAVNEKNLRPYNIPNLIQVYGMSNHRDALHVHMGARRYFCVWCGVPLAADVGEQRRREQMFSDYWTWLDHGGGRAAVMGHLMRRDVRHILPGAKPMETEWLADMIALARDPLAAWLVDQIDARVGIFGWSHVSAEEICAVIQRDHSSNWRGVSGATPQRVSQALVSIGVPKDRVWIPRDQGYRTRFCLRPETMPHKDGRDNVIRMVEWARGRDEGGGAGGAEAGDVAWL